MTIPTPLETLMMLRAQKGDVVCLQVILDKIKNGACRAEEALFGAEVAASLGEENVEIAMLSWASGNFPEDARPLIALGKARYKRHEYDQAQVCFEQGLLRSKDPEKVDALAFLAAIAIQRQDYRLAITLCDKALAVDPKHYDGLVFLGDAYRLFHRMDDAIKAYEMALEQRPDQSQLLVNLANLYRSKMGYAEAEDLYKRAITLAPNHGSIRFNYGNLLQSLGRFEEARAQLNLATTYSNDVTFKIRRAMLCPVLAASVRQIAEVRADIKSRLEELLLTISASSIHDPFVELGFTNFYLAYQNCNDVELQKKFAQVLVKACPSLVWRARHCDRPAPIEGRRLKVGFCSSFWYDHTILKLNERIASWLDKDKFEVILIHTGTKRDSETERLEAEVDRVVTVSRDNYWQARDQVAALELDVLYYPDLGMTTLSFMLAFARLAPVQCTTWGHPVTSGLDNMDYFISAQGLETADNTQDQYSEELIRFDRVNTCYRRPSVKPAKLERADLGLPEQGRLYLCPQSLFKLHPDFDETLKLLLKEDPEGYLVFIKDSTAGYLANRLRTRFQQTLGKNSNRVHIVERQSFTNFLGLLKLADAVIDVPQFSGGNSTLEAFSVGVPIICWPSSLMRGRITYALYTQIAMTELIAHDHESFVRLAIRYASDLEWKAQVQAKLISKVDALYDDREIVRQYEEFFWTSYQRRLAMLDD